MKIRFGVLLAFILCGLLSLYLGFANLSIPNDKFVHFSVFFVMSGLFFWVTESTSLKAIRTFTFVICTLLGGIGSEFVQGFLPYRTFDPYDIAANVGGSLSAIILSNFYYRYTLKKKRKQSGRVRVADLERQVRILDDETEGLHPRGRNDDDVLDDESTGSVNQPFANNTSTVSGNEGIELTAVQPMPIDIR